MSAARSLKVGTLGGPATFAGEATDRMRELHPEFGAPAYFLTMDDCWLALKAGTVDVAILGIERTGQPHHGQAVISNGFYVMGLLAQPLNCSLYVKPGTRTEDIRSITGHGSIHQCTSYLDRHFPGVPRKMHALNSVAAAREVMAADGTIAVVGSRSLPRLVDGLEEIAASIDEGAISSWWAVTAKPLFSDQPSVLIVTGRFEPDGQLGNLISAVSGQSYRLTTAAAFPVDRGVSVYDYILSFAGKGRRAEVEQAVARFEGTRLVGAFEQRG